MNLRVFAIAVLAASAGHCAAQPPDDGPTSDGGLVTTHVLPPLPYAYDASEPYVSKQTMRLHHDKHQAAYVAGLNKAEEALREARKTGDYALIQNWERKLAFNASGDLLHTIFFHNMSPDGGGKPTGELLRQIEKDFGSYESFKSQFSAAAVAVEGNGWSLLGWHPGLRKLYVLQVENHSKLTIWGIEPLLVLDVWEHAYYLQYQNRRAEWVANWWNIVNWPDVAARLAEARKHLTRPNKP